MDPATLDMIAKTHAEEKVQLRMRIVELEAALQSILDIDPLQFIERGDANNQSTAHLLIVEDIALKALS